MSHFQLIDCNAGQSRQIESKSVPPTLIELLLPAVEEGTGLYQELFYRIELFPESAGARIYIAWHEEEGEPILDCFVNWHPDPYLVWDRLKENYHHSRFLPIDTAKVSPNGKFVATMRYTYRFESELARDEEYPGWKHHLENLVIGLADILIASH